jgi:peptidoglycan/LPS O-acetylase OafA/YrhL
MQNPISWLLFALFGLILFVMYVSLRRHWASPVAVSALGVLGSVIVMTLTGLAQDNTIYQAIFAGLLVGGLFSGGTVAMAAYFQSNEKRQQAAQPLPPEEG